MTQVLASYIHKYIYEFPSAPAKGMELMGFFFLGLAGIFFASHVFEKNRKVLLYEDRVVLIKARDKVLLETPFASISKLKAYRNRGGAISLYEITTEGGKTNGFGANTENAQDLVKAIESKTNLKF